MPITWWERKAIVKSKGYCPLRNYILIKTAYSNIFLWLLTIPLFSSVRGMEEERKGRVG